VTSLILNTSSVLAVRQTNIVNLVTEPRSKDVLPDSLLDEENILYIHILTSNDNNSELNYEYSVHTLGILYLYSMVHRAALAVMVANNAAQFIYT
jgi:hypothetical protein